MIFRSLIAISFACLSGAQAWACSCLPPDSQTVSEYIGKRTVFVGTPIQPQPTSEERDFYGSTITTFKVHKSLQGELGETVEIEHHQSGATCGIRYKPGVTDIIIASQTEDGLSTSMCSNQIPRNLIIDLFEKQKDLFMMARWECKDKGLLVQNPESEHKYGDDITTQDSPSCEIHTVKGWIGMRNAWHTWLEQQYFN